MIVRAPEKTGTRLGIGVLGDAHWHLFMMDQYRQTAIAFLRLAEIIACSATGTGPGGSC
jgi:hypothetical protein